AYEIFSELEFRRVLFRSFHAALEGKVATRAAKGEDGVQAEGGTGKMMQAVVVERPGGPEALAVRELPVPEPGPGQVRVRVEAAGVNYIDIYHRSGLYPRE